MQNYVKTVHAGESGDEQFCAVHLINEGVTVDQRSASIFFRGTEAVKSYLCRLSDPDVTNSDFTTCETSMNYACTVLNELVVFFVQSSKEKLCHRLGSATVVTTDCTLLFCGWHFWNSLVVRAPLG